MHVFFISSCGEKEKETVPKLVWYLPMEQQEDMSEVLAAANEIIIPKIGAELEIRPINVDRYEDMMNMKASVKEDYDLCFTGYINLYRQAAKAGSLLCIDDYLEKMPELKAMIPDYAWYGAEIEGHIYAVPNMQFIAYCTVVVVDADMAEKYELDTSSIHHITDMEPFFEKIKKNEPEKIAYNPVWGNSCMVKLDRNVMHHVIDDIYWRRDENGNIKVMTSAECPEFHEAFYKIRDWYEKGYVPTTIMQRKNMDPGRGKVVSGVAMYKPGMEGEAAAGGTKIKGIRITEPGISARAGTTAMTGVGRWSKNPEKALKLIELVNTDKELFNILSFGIEGKHYLKTGENRIELKSRQESGYFVNAAWKFGNQFLAYILPGQPDDVWEETKYLNETAKREVGFKPNTDNIDDELTRIATVYEQYNAINDGTLSPDEYLPEFIEKLHEAGSDKVAEELERQLREYYGE